MPTSRPDHLNECQPLNATVLAAVGRKSLHTGRLPKDISRLIVGSRLLPSPNACRSCRMSFPNGLGATAEAAQKGFHAPLESTFAPGNPRTHRSPQRDVRTTQRQQRRCGPDARDTPLAASISRFETALPRWIAPKSESFASKIFRHSGITVAFKTTFEVFTRVGPDNSLERLTERSVGLVTDRPSNVYELFVTLL